jgi:murein DD-endopeptidase MepM/ murein hydrolase activator NlpD
MKIILVDQRHGNSRTIILKGWAKGLLSICLLGAPVALGFFGYELAVSRNPQVYNEQTAINWERQLKVQSEQLSEIKQQSKEQLEALTKRLAMMQARLVRLDAVGERVVTVANLDEGEFDFSQPVGVGGPASEYSVDYSIPQFMDAIEQLENNIDDRQQQLDILEGLLANRQIQTDSYIAGRPVERGWISSRFGRRTDPFTGKLTLHQGVDFSSERGTEINSVAAGVVTWSAQKAGYGLMVEINHGNGFTTRYAHADQLLVEMGEIVKKAQTVALVGDTGRTTGPHVHFEVFKNGRVVDPASYINRTVQ